VVPTAKLEVGVKTPIRLPARTVIVPSTGFPAAVVNRNVDPVNEAGVIGFENVTLIGLVTTIFAVPDAGATDIIDSGVGATVIEVAATES
jgi:hypothetical protein